MFRPPAIAIHDDRGRSVELWRSPANLQIEDAVPTDLRLRIAAVIADRHKGILREPLTAAHLPMVLAFLAIMIAPAIFGILGIVAPRYVTPIAIGLAVPAFAYFRTRAIQRGMAATLRTTLLAEGHCASCGYSMRGLPPEPDGCTICPECSAAWTVGTITHRPSVGDEPKDDPTDIEQNRADRRHLQNTLRSFGLRRRFATVDASGQIVGLVSPDPFAKRPAAWHRLDPGLRRRLGWRFLRLGLGLRISFAVLTVPGAVIMTWSWARTGMSNPLADPMMFIARVFGTFIWPVFIALFVFRPHVKKADVIVDLMLREGCCPSCAEPLTARPLDTHAPCRTCGATWDICKTLIGSAHRGQRG